MSGGSSCSNADRYGSSRLSAYNSAVATLVINVPQGHFIHVVDVSGYRLYNA